MAGLCNQDPDRHVGRDHRVTRIRPEHSEGLGRVLGRHECEPEVLRAVEIVDGLDVGRPRDCDDALAPQALDAGDGKGGFQDDLRGAEEDGAEEIECGVAVARLRRQVALYIDMSTVVLTGRAGRPGP